MRIASLSLALLLSAAFTLRAGLVVVQKVEGEGQSGTMTLKIQGDKIRADVSPTVSMITDTASGSVITLMHQQKITLEMSLGAATQLLDRVHSQSRLGEGQADPGAKLHTTGKHETVNGVATEVFTSEIGPVTATYWIAKDYPNGATILAALKKIQASAMGAMAKGVIGQVTEFPGVPVKTEMQLSPKQKVIATLLSATEQPLPDSDFIPPADYKPLASPIFGPLQ
jgi:hypothetical protein